MIDYKNVGTKRLTVQSKILIMEVGIFVAGYVYVMHLLHLMNG